MRMTRGLLGDVAVALLLGAVGVVGTLGASMSSPLDRPVDAGGLVLVLAAAAAVAARRLQPVIILVVVGLLASGYLLLEYPYGPILFSFAVAVYTAARYRPLSVAGPAALAVLPLLLIHVFTHDGAVDALGGFAGVLPGSAWVVVPFAIGATVRANRESAARQRAEVIRRSVYDERLRVAQEVHDVVGHGLAAIKMQADVALHLLNRKPDQAETALTAISRTSTEALDELRATLALVHEPGLGREGAGTGPGDGVADRSPVPGLARLADLRRRMEEAGLRIDVETAGEPRELPAKVDLVAYRVVQESLTNVLKHSDAKVAAVRVDYGADTVALWISNPLAGTGTLRQGGLGIPGMRDRVTSVGGEFAAGATPDGRFEVRAVLPMGGG